MMEDAGMTGWRLILRKLWIRAVHCLGWRQWVYVEAGVPGALVKEAFFVDGGLAVEYANELSRKGFAMNVGRKWLWRLDK